MIRLDSFEKAANLFPFSNLKFSISIWAFSVLLKISKKSLKTFSLMKIVSFHFVSVYICTHLVV